MRRKNQEKLSAHLRKGQAFYRGILEFLEQPDITVQTLLTELSLWLETSRELAEEHEEIAGNWNEIIDRLKLSINSVEDMLKDKYEWSGKVDQGALYAVPVSFVLTMALTSWNPLAAVIPVIGGYGFAKHEGQENVKVLNEFKEWLQKCEDYVQDEKFIHSKVKHENVQYQLIL